ncbi:hypothetical protein [Kordia sp.]|uniref:hypothetical protein n=1 Tax=Kordia sp. TaxID=1965332 RepID=UPI003D6C3FCD
MEITNYNGDTDTAKKAVEKAKQAAKETQAYINKVKEIIKKGGNISKIQALALKLDGIGKASIVFGIISGGLELAIMLSGEPSPQEKIMNMLTEISEQIKELGERIEYQFERLKKYINYRDLKSKQANAATKLNSAIALMDLYRKIKKDPKAPDYKQRLKDCEKRLKALDRNDIFNQIQVFSDLVTGNSGLDKIFDVSKDYTNGDLVAIMVIGNSMLTYTFSAMNLDGLLSGLKYKEEGMDNDQIVKASLQNTKELYTPLITNIKNHLKQAMEYVIDEKNSNYYIKNHLENEVFPSVSKSDLDITAKHIGEILKKQWPWLDWAVITYDPTSSKYHGETGASFCFYDQKVKDGKLNIVLSKIKIDLNNNKKALEDFANHARYKETRQGVTDFYIKDHIKEFNQKSDKIGIKKHRMLWLLDSQCKERTRGFYGTSDKWKYYDKKWWRPRIWRRPMLCTSTGGLPITCNVILHA